jgi:RNA polymerase sigma factor (sigma-70 family)
MAGQDWLSERFAEHQGRLRALAYRMLGSSGEAEDAVQDAWLRVSRADVEQVDNFGGWLTTVVARVCLNMLEARRSRPEDSAGIQPPEQSARGGHGAGPEDEMLLADSVGAALMVVLDTLAPAERLAFVLHDVFDVPFDQIAMIIDRTPAAARQIASRARRRVIAAGVEPEPDLPRRQKIVAAFLAASRSGDFGALLELLAPEAILRFHPTAQEISMPDDIRGADEVAGFFLARGAQAARLALVDGIPAAVWAPAGRPRAVFAFAISGDKITSIGLVADPDQLQDLDIVFLSSRGAPVRKVSAATHR